MRVALSARSRNGLPSYSRSSVNMGSSIGMSPACPGDRRNVIRIVQVTHHARELNGTVFVLEGGKPLHLRHTPSVHPSVGPPSSRASSYAARRNRRCSSSSAFATTQTPSSAA